MDSCDWTLIRDSAENNCMIAIDKSLNVKHCWILNARRLLFLYYLLHEYNIWECVCS